HTHFTLFPYTTLFRSRLGGGREVAHRYPAEAPVDRPADAVCPPLDQVGLPADPSRTAGGGRAAARGIRGSSRGRSTHGRALHGPDRKSTRLNSSHDQI